jgi:uncharacterized membrane protein
MPHMARFWAIGYENSARAEEARARIDALAGHEPHLSLLDIAILERHLDGTYTLDREPFPATGNIFSGRILRFLAGFALFAPVTDGAVDAMLGSSAATTASAIGIEDKFIQDMKNILKPGSSTLLVLDDDGEIGEILRGIRGMGGTVLKTNVDVERAKLIQATLNADALKSANT